MKFSKNLFFILILSIFLTSCSSLRTGKKSSVEITHEKFMSLENQYEELLSFQIELEKLELLQEKYQKLSQESHTILLSESPEKKLSKKERTLLTTLINNIYRRIKILEDLKD